MTSIIIFLFFFNDTATTEIYTLSLHDALPISSFQITAISEPTELLQDRREEREEHDRDAGGLERGPARLRSRRAPHGPGAHRADHGAGPPPRRPRPSRRPPRSPGP